MILNCGEERRILPRRQKKKKLGLAIFGVNFVCHNCRVLLTSSGQMQDCCLNILKSIARLPTTQMSIAPRLRNSGLDLYLGRVTKFSVSQADFLLVAIFHVLLLFFSSCCVLQVDKNKFRRQYTANFPKNSPNLTNYEKNTDIQIPSNKFSMFNTYSTAGSLLLLNPDNAYSFKLFTDHFSLSESEILNNTS